MFSFIDKTGLSPSKKNFICFSESPLKMMKNDIYFMLKALFVQYLHFTFWLYRKTAW